MIVASVIVTYWKKKACFAQSAQRGGNAHPMSIRKSFNFKKLKFIGSPPDVEKNNSRPSMRIEPNTVKVITNKFQKMEHEKGPVLPSTINKPALPLPTAKPTPPLPAVKATPPLPTIKPTTPQQSVKIVPRTNAQLTRPPPTIVPVSKTSPKLNLSNVNKFEAIQKQSNLSSSQSSLSKNVFKPAVEQEVVYDIPNPVLRPVQLHKEPEPTTVSAMKKMFEKK